MSPSALFVTTVPITLEAFLVPFAEHFTAQGWRIDALANGATTHEPIADAFDRRFDVAWSRNPLAPANFTGTAARVRAIVAEGGYDLVHVHTPIAAFVTRYALRDRSWAQRPQVIYTAHGFHFFRGQAPAPHALFRTMERLAAPWTDYLVTINAEDFAAAQELGGIAPQRVRFIPGIGVDTTRYGPSATDPATARAVRDGLGVGTDEFMLTMVAELADVKRHALALEAFASVSTPGVRLVLVGSGPLESALREKAVALDVADRIVWAGYRRDVPAVLAATDALLLVSEREGLNRSALEAMATGVPVIGTPTRGIADAIGETGGWIADAPTPRAVADAIEAAVIDPAQRALRGASARERACAEFSLDRILAAYQELYDEALASRL